MIWPTPIIKPLVTIVPFSLESLGFFSFAANTVNVNGAAAAVWPAANRAIYIPFFIGTSIIAKMMFCYNGGVVAGNIDVGIYDSAGTKIVSKGSTAMSGSNTIQTFDITDTELPPGQYYMAMAASDGTATFFRMSFNTQQQGQAVGMAQQASALPLPATATFAANTATYLPLFGLSTRTVI